VYDDHPAPGIEELNVINYFRLAPIHVQDRATHQMFAQQSPALLIDERWIRLLIVSRPDEDGVVVDFDNLFPGDECIRPAHAVFDINPDCVGKRLYQPKNQVRDLPYSPAEFTAQIRRLSSCVK
jgi:hypothetical protein